MTRSDLAEKAGITSVAITQYELGYRVPDSAQVIRDLARALGIRTGDLMAVCQDLIVYAYGEFRPNEVLVGEKQDLI